MPNFPTTKPVPDDDIILLIIILLSIFKFQNKNVFVLNTNNNKY